MNYPNYTKMRDGSWGVRIPSELSKGKSLKVKVRKRSGEIKSEFVTVIWAGKGISLATIKRNQNPSRRVFSATICDECERSGATYRRQDSSGISGMVCHRCNMIPSYELSFA